jgi:hypothetical protein
MKIKQAVTNNKAAKPIPAPIPAFAPVLRPVPVPDEDVLASRSAPVLRPVPDEDVLASRDVVVEVNVAAESLEGVLLDEISIGEVEGDDVGPGVDVGTLVPVMRASI